MRGYMAIAGERQSSSGEPLIFLKLGGSLITEKDQPHTARLEVLDRLAQEIAEARRLGCGRRLILGHGSGSFGHVPASRYGTRWGVHHPDEWIGFSKVWQEAAALNRLVMDAVLRVELPALAFPPSAALIAQDGRPLRWELGPLQMALQAGLLPVVYGDVVFDTRRGGTIFSTEDLFDYLARLLRPQCILLAGIEPGVWADYPACTQLLDEIGPEFMREKSESLQSSEFTDVTGGMRSKVSQALDLVQAIPEMQVRIFSGVEPGSVYRALCGQKSGTLVHMPA
jgi:isopentenyl phosphate kinase